MTNVEDVLKALTQRLDEAVSLLVARGSGDEIEAHKLLLANDAADGLLELCRSTIDKLSDRSVAPYTATAELERDEIFVIDDADTLAELADLTGLGSHAATLPHEAPSDLDAKVQMYAVVLGDKDRVSFVKKSDPVIPHGSGTRLFAVGGEQLRRLDEPAFAFRPGFDLIASDTWVIILNQGAFERLFRELGLIERHIDSWVEGITDHFPMSKASVGALTAAAKADSRMWRRMREIKSRGHLAHVTLDEIEQYATSVGIAKEEVVHDGELFFDPANRFSFLHLLNEDVYKGFLTEERFEVQRKAST